MRTDILISGINRGDLEKACKDMGVRIININDHRAEVEYDYAFSLFYAGTQTKNYERSREISEEFKKMRNEFCKS